MQYPPLRKKNKISLFDSSISFSWKNKPIKQKTERGKTLPYITLCLVPIQGLVCNVLFTNLLLTDYLLREAAFFLSGPTTRALNDSSSLDLSGYRNFFDGFWHYRWEKKFIKKLFFLVAQPLPPPHIVAWPLKKIPYYFLWLPLPCSKPFSIQRIGGKLSDFWLSVIMKIGHFRIFLTGLSSYRISWKILYYTFRWKLAGPDWRYVAKNPAQP